MTAGRSRATSRVVVAHARTVNTLAVATGGKRALIAIALLLAGCGSTPRKPAPTADYDEEEWNRIFDINLRGMFLCMKHEIPLIQKHGGGGAIVNTSSGAGVIGIKGSPAYTAAKHGVIGLTRAAALDYAAQNIRINAVCPGYIDTPMMDRFTGGTPEGRAKVIAEEPAGRMGKPEEIGAAVVWLCSDDAAFMVGHAMVIDGGQTVQ